jgi:hypothetical protein
MKCEMHHDRRWDVAYFTNKTNDLAIVIKTHTHLLRLLNGRSKAFFEGRVVNKILQLGRMLTDEESEGIAW